MEKTVKFGEDLNGVYTEKLNDLKIVLPFLFDVNGNLKKEELKSFLDEYKEAEPSKFEFTWAGKEKAKRLAFADYVDGALEQDGGKGKETDTTKNIIIEGENLQVLHLLRKSYKNKIKCIYIDPPYNTGNDFVYNDKFELNIKQYQIESRQIDEQTGEKTDLYDYISKDDGRKHSKWLSFIYPRLLIARDLLTDDGVIFISIDDNEQANLKLVMNEVFGEENFVGQITISSNPRGRDYGGIAKMHDYLFVYAKSEDININNLLDEDKEFPYQDEKGGFETRELRNRNVAFNVKNRPNLYYPFYINPNSRDDNGFYEISLEKKDNWIELFPKESQGIKTVWRWGREKSASSLNIEIVGKKMQDEGWQIVDKYREKTRMARSIWNDKDVNTEKGTLAVKGLLDGKYFDFPKSVEMVKRVIEMGTNPNDIILDFFAGSGTTGQAVMELNFEEVQKKEKEGMITEEREVGRRKFILVQIPEKIDEKKEAYKAGYRKISDITIERVRRAGEKYNGVDTGFKVFTLQPNPKETEEDLFAFVRQHDSFILNLVCLFYGYGLNYKKQKLDFGKNIYEITSEFENRKALVILENDILDSDIITHLSNLSTGNQSYTIFAKETCLNIEIIYNICNYFKKENIIRI